MPYIDIKVSKTVLNEQAQKVKADLGKAISVFPGKSEEWLMVGVTDDVRLWIKGDDSAPSAMVEISILGSIDSASCAKMTPLVCETVNKNFGISPDRIYIKYQAVTDWGWNNINF